MIVNEARQFVAKFVSGEYDPEEYAAFLQWLEKDATIDELGNIADEHEALYEKWSLPTIGPTAEWVDQLEKRLDHMDQEGEQAPVKRLYPAGVVRKRVVVAAASIVLLTAGAYLWYSHSVPKPPAVAGSKGNDLYTVYSVPRGGAQREVLLADGSKVWLNAASSVKYTADAAGHQRVIELSGEAFFDVAKMADMPFRVKVKGADIEVLGTRFNVKAYDDEAVSRTTLVDGAIRVSSGVEAKVLQPGDQAEVPYMSSGVSIRLSHGADLDNVLAWKNGDMEFNDDNLASVMREISRCYNLDVKLEEGVGEKRFTGNLSRKSSIQQIIDQLRHQDIQVRLDERTIVVTH